jgi:hypothetical protein
MKMVQLFIGAEVRCYCCLRQTRSHRAALLSRLSGASPGRSGNPYLSNCCPPVVTGQSRCRLDGSRLGLTGAARVERSRPTPTVHRATISRTGPFFNHKFIIRSVPVARARQAPRLRRANGPRPGKRVLSCRFASDMDYSCAPGLPWAGTQRGVAPCCGVAPPCRRVVRPLCLRGRAGPVSTASGSRGRAAAHRATRRRRRRGP